MPSISLSRLPSSQCDVRGSGGLSPQPKRVGLFFSFVFICAFLASSTQPFAQKDEGKEKHKPIAPYALIKGSVFAESGLSLRGAKVMLRKAGDKKPKWETLSGEGGEFAFRVPPGKSNYVVTSRMQGYEENSREVQIENDERVDISVVLKRKANP